MNSWQHKIRKIILLKHEIWSGIINTGERHAKHLELGQRWSSVDFM